MSKWNAQYGVERRCLFLHSQFLEKQQISAVFFFFSFAISLFFSNRYIGDDREIFIFKTKNLQPNSLFKCDEAISFVLKFGNTRCNTNFGHFHLSFDTNFSGSARKTIIKCHTSQTSRFCCLCQKHNLGNSTQIDITLGTPLSIYIAGALCCHRCSKR